MHIRHQRPAISSGEHVDRVTTSFERMSNAQNCIPLLVGHHIAVNAYSIRVSTMIAYPLDALKYSD